MGEGFNRLANLTLSIANSENGVVLIDEIENGLHYSVHVDVWKAIANAAREFKVQVFATTHSLEMIRAAHQAFKDDEPYDFRLHRLYRSQKTNQIDVATFKEDNIETAIDMNLELR